MTHQLYDILGVPPDASPEAIKAAHRAKAKQHHPDAGGDPEKFGEVQRAYDVLSDPEARARYDTTGIAETNDPVVRIDSMAREYIANLLIATIQNDRDMYFNWLDSARSKSKSDRRKLEGNRDTLTRKRKTAEKLAERFRAKGTHNIPRDVVAGICRDMDRTLAQIDEQTKVLDRVDYLLEEYEFEPDPPPPVPAWFTGQTNTTNGR